MEDSISAEVCAPSNLRDRHKGNIHETTHTTDALLVKASWITPFSRQHREQPVVCVTFGPEEGDFEGTNIHQEDVQQLREALLDVLYLNAEYLCALNPCTLMDDDILRIDR